MKPFLIILLLAFLGCTQTTQQKNLEKDVFVIDYSKAIDSSGTLISDTSAMQPLYFSTDFWDFFIRKFPLSSGMIFLSTLPKDYIKLADSSFTYFEIDFLMPNYFKELLPIDPSMKERNNSFHGGFLVLRKDTTGESEKQKRIDKNLSSYHLTADVRKQYNELYKLLTDDKQKEHYVIIYKKDFCNKIYDLYK